jgi:hypothetical protein
MMGSLLHMCRQAVRPASQLDRLIAYTLVFF